MDYTHHYESPLGGITLASDGEALTGLWFDGQKYFADTLDREHTEKVLPVFEQTVRWLDIYFSGRAPDFTPPLCMRTTAFRRLIWELMLTIPFGQTRTFTFPPPKETGAKEDAMVIWRLISSAS